MSRRQQTGKRQSRAAALPKSFSSAHDRDKIRDLLGYSLLGFAILFAACVRLRLLSFPLERDEGEYAYAGQLMLQGFPPYQLAYNMKLPGIYAAYAAIIGLFGESIAGLHFGLLLVNLATIVLVFLLGRRLLDRTAGGAAAASYAFLSVSPSVLGFAGHATHFVVLPALGGILLLLRAINRSHCLTLLCSGLLFGLALLMKQPGVVFSIFAGCYLIYAGWRARLPLRHIALRLMILMLGVSAPFLLTCSWMKWAGVFDQFWFWTVGYASKYGAIIPASVGMQIFWQNIGAVMGSAWPLWALAAAGLTAFAWNEKARCIAGFSTAFACFSFLGVCLGFHFRQHYFILLLPALALLAGIAVSAAAENFERWPGWAWSPQAVFALALGYAVRGESSFLFKIPPLQGARLIYGANPFPESLVLADYLRANTLSTDTIAILGSEPQIYFYSSRHSATGHIYTYGLMEQQPFALRMQEEMIRQIEAARPAYVVFVNVSVSWLAQPGSEKRIFQWWEKYASEYLEQVGFADILSSTQTVYHLGDQEGRTTLPKSQYFVTIFKRKAGF